LSGGGHRQQVFPYYSVYFKALLQTILIRQDPIKFPYYSVYFKALRVLIVQHVFDIFPYYSVYFKAHEPLAGTLDPA